MALEIPRSNFQFIAKNFSDIIQEIREGSNGINGGSKDVRKTIVFYDFSKLYCHESLDAGGEFIELHFRIYSLSELFVKTILKGGSKKHF